MTVRIRQYQFVDQQSYYEIELRNQRGMRVKLLNYGATLEKILLPLHQGLRNVVLSLAHPADYSRERTFIGGTVGRFGGRLPGHIWSHGQVKTILAANEGNNSIHGGQAGFDTQLFDFSYQEKAHSDEVSFVRVDPAGHNGLPGNLKVVVKYWLDDRDRLSYMIEAFTDAVTLFNPTSHVYFALDGANTTGPDTVITLASKYYQPLTPEHLPIDGWHRVSHSVFDLQHGQRLQQILNSRHPQIQLEQGLNHPFLLENGQRLAARLTSSDRRVTLNMQTTAPAVIAYTANHFTGSRSSNGIQQHAGIALEAQHAPFSGTDWSAITLLPGEPFTRQVSWQFKYA